MPVAGLPRKKYPAEHVPEQACQPYHLITAIGCLGLSKSRAEYKRAFSHCADNLISGGVFFGVDWIRSPALIEKEQHDNSYLGIDLTRSCATQKELDTLYLQRCSILHDPAYDKLIIWIFQKP